MNLESWVSFVESWVSFASMSSSGPSSETNADVGFEDLWRQLGKCHQNALQELEAKVTKLKKDRCLDAERLKQFIIRNQQLKEQNQTLQDTINGLEERLRATECERCAIFEKNLKRDQARIQHLINKLVKDKKTLQDKNGRLNAELEKLKKACLDQQRASSQESDDCIIPDSPVIASSLPAVNKLKKRKHLEKSNHVRYAEISLAHARSSLFIENEENIVKVEVLVPNTCELDASQTNVDPYSEDIIAETCRLDLAGAHRMKRQKVITQQHSPETSSIPNPPLNPDTTTGRSPSLLPLMGFSNVSVVNKAKQKKEERRSEVREEKCEIHGGVEKSNTSKIMHHELEEQSTTLNQQSLKAGGKSKSKSKQEETHTKKANVFSISPVFKKPNGLGIKLTQPDIIGTKKPPLKDRNNSLSQQDGAISQRELKLEPMWSIDPAIALEMYESEQGADKEKDCPGESVDTDYTWISHSVFQGQDGGEASGLGDKANDSLDRIFDTSAWGEYKSYNTLHMDQDQHTVYEVEDEEEQEEDIKDEAESSMNRRKPQQPTFAHVAVVRKKEERRKLKGTTCKECEIYYARLPEDDKQKKLSTCSRHRYLHIPPSTPENFWEVGFPSTQTCIERGYIKEEKDPETRLRRRQPLNALFSPKGNQQKK